MISEVNVVVRGQNRMGGVRINMRCEQFVVEGERFSDGYSRSRVEGSDEQSRSRPLLCDVLKEERGERCGGLYPRRYRASLDRRPSRRQSSN